MVTCRNLLPVTATLTSLMSRGRHTQARGLEHRVLDEHARLDRSGPKVQAGSSGPTSCGAKIPAWPGRSEKRQSSNRTAAFTGLKKNTGSGGGLSTTKPPSRPNLLRTSGAGWKGPPSERPRLRVMMAQQARHPSITKRQRLRDLPVPCLYVKQAACAGIVSREPPSIWTQHQLAGALAPSL
jgi:hypothetical protein